MLFGIFSKSKPLNIQNAADLRDFLDSRAAYVSQRATMEYVRARSGSNWDKLMLEVAFLEAMERCRWWAFAAVLSDLTVMVRDILRPQASESLSALNEALAAAAAAVLSAHPAPPDSTDGWQGTCTAIAHRLAETALSAPHPVHEIADVGGRRIHAVLPIHPTLSMHDVELVRNNVRFAVVRIHGDFVKAAKPEALLASLGL